MGWRENILLFCKKYGSIVVGVGKTALTIGKKEIEKLPGGSVIAKLIEIALETGKETLDDRFDINSKDTKLLKYYIDSFELKFEKNLKNIPDKEQLSQIIAILNNSEKSLNTLTENLNSNLTEITDKIAELTNQNILLSKNLKRFEYEQKTLISDVQENIILEVHKSIKYNDAIQSKLNNFNYELTVFSGSAKLIIDGIDSLKKGQKVIIDSIEDLKKNTPKEYINVSNGGSVTIFQAEDDLQKKEKNLKKANTFFKMGNFSGAEKFFFNAFENDPNDGFSAIMYAVSILEGKHPNSISLSKIEKAENILKCINPESEFFKISLCILAIIKNDVYVLSGIRQKKPFLDEILNKLSGYNFSDFEKEILKNIKCSNNLCNILKL